MTPLFQTFIKYLLDVVVIAVIIYVVYKSFKMLVASKRKEPEVKDFVEKEETLEALNDNENESTRAYR